MKLNVTQLYRVALWTSILGVCAFVIDFGFNQSYLAQQIVDAFYFFVIAIGLISTFTRYFENIKLIRRRVFAFDLLSVFYTLYIFYMYLFVGDMFKTDLILENPAWVILAVLLTFFREFFEVKLNLNRTFLNPAQLFIASNYSQSFHYEKSLLPMNLNPLDSFLIYKFDDHGCGMYGPEINTLLRNGIVEMVILLPIRITQQT